MTRAQTGLILALLGSLALGVLSGLVFHRLFLSNIPQQWLSSFQANVSSFTFVGTGALLGLAICAWALLVAWLAPRFRGKKKDAGAATQD